MFVIKCLKNENGAPRIDRISNEAVRNRTEVGNVLANRVERNVFEVL